MVALVWCSVHFVFRSSFAIICRVLCFSLNASLSVWHILLIVSRGVHGTVANSCNLWTVFASTIRKCATGNSFVTFCFF